MFALANLDCSVPLCLRTGLDGPKWAEPSGARRSHSRPADQSRPTDAPSKPRSGHSEVQQARLRSSARRLFDQSSSSASSTSESPFGDQVSDSAPTPRPHRHSRSSSVPALESPVVGHRSFLQDFIPRAPPPALVQDLRHLGHAAAAIAGGIAGGATTIVHSVSSSGSPPPLSEPSPSSQLADPSPPISPSSSLHVPRSASPLGPTVPPPVMATVLPLPKDINVKDVCDFDSTPADLSLFDTQIENALGRWDILAYSGGCVSGDVSHVFEFVVSSTAGCVPNYRLGGKLCSGLCNKLTGAAAQWWDDYAKSGKPRPNCWKRATDHLFVPAGLVEVSLYDLLASQFDPTVDAQ